MSSESVTEKLKHSFSFRLVCSSRVPSKEESLFLILEGLGVTNVWSEHLPGGEVEVYALLEEHPGSVWLEEFDRRLNKAASADKHWSVSVSPYQESDWLKEWKKFYKPERVGGLWILPEWESPESYDGMSIRIDPGMAFGTGGHPTTRMSLLFLEEVLKEPGSSLLDMGTGSGILAIAAVKLGYGIVTGVDNDITALENAGKNITLNGVSVQLRSLVPEKACFDFIVSNIIAETHIELAGLYRSALEPTGKIILSGILETKKEMVLDVMSGAGFDLEKELGEDEWVSLLLKFH